MSATREQAGQDTESGDFRHRFEFAAPIDAVYEAIATKAIRDWWTEDADIATEVGSVSQMRFGDFGWTDLRVDRLERPHKIDWTCVAQSMTDFRPTDEWVGTTISFELTEIEGGTRLDFVHQGLTSLNCNELCETGWQFHIGQSLKALLENGA